MASIPLDKAVVVEAFAKSGVKEGLHVAAC